MFNKKSILIFIIAFLLCSACFALGWLARGEYAETPIIIQTK